MTQPRKGARRVSEVPPEILAALVRGEIETANLVEWLAVDQRLLVEHVLPTVGLAKAVEEVLAELAALPSPTAMKFTRAIGQRLALLVPIKDSPRSPYQKLLRHPSDIVRNWLPFVVGGQADLEFSERLEAIRPLAADSHFGVREAAWMGLRPSVEANLEAAIDLLVSWSLDADVNVRRFASEVTRPCGVWCSHIQALKAEPKLALPILEPLRSDDSRYVQNSVANWLNDAAKSQPAWVQQLCRSWQRESRTAATAYIVKRGLRSFGK
jgi:3-methyladenine DNA glycosylase AlkC